MHADQKKIIKIAYLNAGARRPPRHLVPSGVGRIRSVNFPGSVAVPGGIINAGSNPYGGTSEL